MFRILDKAVCFATSMAVCFTLMIASTASGETLRIGGTGSALGTMKQIVKAFIAEYPDSKIEVLPSLGSGGGLRALSAGSIGIALSARPLKDKEIAAGLEAKKYGATAIAFAGNIALPAANLTNEQLVEIYQSGDSHWPNGERIRVVLRPERETDTKLMKKFIPNMTSAIDAARSIPGVPTAYNDQEIAEMLERIPGSLGTSTLSLLLSEGRKLQVFSLNGVQPNRESIQDGSYPMTKEFYLVVPKSPTEIAKKMKAFVFSPKGAEILTKYGHLAG